MKRFIWSVLFALCAVGTARADFFVQAGSTSVMLPDIFIQDSTVTTGAGKTGLAYNTVGLTCYYYRSGGSASSDVSVSLQSASLGTYTSGGFVQIDSVGMPGHYVLMPPNTALAVGTDGATAVTFCLTGATGMVQAQIRVNLWSVNPYDGTAFGISRIDASVSSRVATSALPTNFSTLAIDGSGRVTVGSLANGSITSSTLASGAITSSTFASGALGAMWDEPTASHAVTNTFGKLIGTNLDTNVGSRMATFTLPTNFSSLVIDGSGRIDMGKWVGVAPSALINGMVQAAPAVLDSGTAQGGGSSTITLRAGASSVNSFYSVNSSQIYIASGVGAGQMRTITSYVGSSQVATVATAWTTTPDNTSQYVIFGLAGLAPSATDPWTVALPGSYSAGQAGYIIGHNIDAQVSTRSTVTESSIWSTVIEPHGSLSAANILDLDASVLLGRSLGFTGAGAPSGATFKTPDNSTVRAVFNPVDAHGNKSGTITLTPAPNP